MTNQAVIAVPNHRSTRFDAQNFSMQGVFQSLRLDKHIYRRLIIIRLTQQRPETLNSEL